MSVSIYIDRGPNQETESLFLCFQRQVCDSWLPVCDSCHLELLKVALTGGLTVTSEYHEPFVHEVETILSTLRRLDPSPGLGEMIERCARLLDTLKKYPPGSGCEVYVG